MNIEKKIIYRILIFSFVIITVIIGMTFYFSSDKKNENLSCGNKSQQFYCGTESTPAEKLEGKNIFNSNCAACHKLESKATGPALRSIDSLKYWKMMKQVNVNIDTTKSNKYGLEYHQSFFHNLTKEDLENIYLYLK